MEPFTVAPSYNLKPSLYIPSIKTEAIPPFYKGTWNKLYYSQCFISRVDTKIILKWKQAPFTLYLVKRNPPPKKLSLCLHKAILVP